MDGFCRKELNKKWSLNTVLRDSIGVSRRVWPKVKVLWLKMLTKVVIIPDFYTIY
jgi:hypothetical protein